MDNRLDMEHFDISGSLTGDPIHRRLLEKLYEWADEDDLRPIDHTFSRWYVLKEGIPLEQAAKALVSSDQYCSWMRYSIRIEDEAALPEDLSERERLLAKCNECHITVIRAGEDDLHFFNYNENRFYEIYAHTVIAAYDVIQLLMEPVR